MKKKILILYAACLSTSMVWSQSIGPSTINATGGSAVISGNTHEFAIGGLLAQTLSGTGIIVTQDVLQPAAETTGIDGKTFFADHIKIFPNPAEEIIFLQPSFASGGTLSYNLYDALGRVVLQVTSPLPTGKEKQTINLKRLASGTYMLSLSFLQKGKTYQATYKVQKLQ